MLVWRAQCLTEGSGALYWQADWDLTAVNLSEISTWSTGSEKNGQQLVLRNLVRVRANGDGGNWALTVCLLLRISGQVVRWGTCQTNNFSGGRAPPAPGDVQTPDCSKLKYTSHGTLGSLVKQNQVNLQQHTGWQAHKLLFVCESWRWPNPWNCYCISPACAYIWKG